MTASLGKRHEAAFVRPVFRKEGDQAIRAIAGRGMSQAGVPHEFGGVVGVAALAAVRFMALIWLGAATPWPAACGSIAGFALRGAAIRWSPRRSAHQG